jgi:hypothetical protein
MSTIETEEVTQTPAQAEEGKALLQRFPSARRSYVANTFLHAVRAGARTPLQVLAHVEHALSESAIRSRRWGFSETVERTEMVYSILNEYHDEALVFCEWAIWWESLPPAERDRQKAARGAEYRTAYMAQKPASDKQISYVRSLGYTGEITSSAHASELIDRLRNGKQGGNRAN